MGQYDQLIEIAERVVLPLLPGARVDYIEEEDGGVLSVWRKDQAVGSCPSYQACENNRDGFPYAFISALKIMAGMIALDSAGVTWETFKSVAIDREPLQADRPERPG